MNRDEIFLQELLRFREGVNINLGDKAPKISFKASYLVPAQVQGQPDTQEPIEININVLDSTQLSAITQLKAASTLNSNTKEFQTAVQNGFNILAADHKDILPSLISSAGVLSETGNGLRIINEEVNSILASITVAANNYSKVHPGDNANVISQLKNPETFTGALNYLPLILYRDYIDNVLVQGNLPKDSLVYGTDGRLINGKTAQSLILSADNNAILGSDIIASYQSAGTKSGLEPNGRYSNFVCYLYYLDSLTGPNYTAPTNVYTSKDKNTKYYRGTPKYIGMKDGMAYAPTAEDDSKEGVSGKKITYFRPLTSIKNFSINGMLISDNDSILLPYIYNYIIKSVEFAPYWFVEAREEDSLNKDSGTAIKNISGFTKEEVEQVRNVMSGILKNLAGNNGISMTQFGFAKESLSKSAIVRFKEAGETETAEEGETTTGTSNQTTKTTAKTASSDSGSLAAEITISLSDEDFEKLMSGPQEAPDSNIKDDSSTATQEEPDQVATTSSEAQA